MSKARHNKSPNPHLRTIKIPNKSSIKITTSLLSNNLKMNSMTSSNQRMHGWAHRRVINRRKRNNIWKRTKSYLLRKSTKSDSLWRNRKGNRFRIKSNKMQVRSKCSWAIISNWRRVKSLTLITAPMICCTDWILNGLHCRLISFTRDRPLKPSLGSKLCPNIHTKYTLFKAVATTPKTTTFT